MTNGYRQYSEQDLDVLQQILFFKELDIPLDQIKLLLTRQQDKLTILHQQQKLFQQKMNRLRSIMNLLDDTIRGVEGAYNMTNEDKFQGFTQEVHQQYQEEAEMLYGQQQGVVDLTELNQVFKKMFLLKTEGYASDSAEVQQVVAILFKLVNQAFNCSLEIFSQIGEMYVNDERFKNNINKFGVGVAEYTNEAIQVFVA